MSKLINISNETYKKLSEMKGEESFTIIIKKLLERKNNTEKVLSFAGKRVIDEKEILKLKEGWKIWTEKYA